MNYITARTSVGLEGWFAEPDVAGSSPAGQAKRGRI